MRRGEPRLYRNIFSAVFLCRSRQESQLFKILADGAGGGAPEDDSFTANHLPGGDAALGSQNCAFFNAHVIGNTDLSADDDSIFNDGAAGDAGLRGDCDVVADMNVVADVHEVVDFRAAADAGFVERAAADGGGGSAFQ